MAYFLIPIILHSLQSSHFDGEAAPAGSFHD